MSVKYKPYKHNPRKINNKQLKQLEDTLRRLGDLSGIIYNRRSKSFIGGNQRSKTIDFDKCERQIIEELKKPDGQGTVAWGFVIWGGHKYNYREVSWTPKIEKEANIVANKGGGDWDFEILKEHFKEDDLLKWGFKQSELTWVEGEAKQSSASASVEPIYQVVIDCSDLSEQERAFNEVQKLGFKCRVLSL